MRERERGLALSQQGPKEVLDSVHDVAVLPQLMDVEHRPHSDDVAKYGHHHKGHTNQHEHLHTDTPYG